MTEKSVSKVSRVINCLIVALLIFAMCMILGLNRVRDKLLFFLSLTDIDGNAKK